MKISNRNLFAFGYNVEPTTIIHNQARRLRCTWYDYYEKSVTFRPFQVNMLNAVTANFLGDSLQCWMQIQVDSSYLECAIEDKLIHSSMTL